MATFLYAICVITCLGGGGYLTLGLLAAESAPQQAAVSAMVAAWVIVTYCLARAVSEMRSLDQRERILKALGEEPKKKEAFGEGWG